MWERIRAFVARQDARFAGGGRRVLLALLLLVALQAWWAKARRGSDFGVFQTAARRFLAGEQLYRLSDGDYPFKYAPVAAVPFVPLVHLPEVAASLFWVLLSAVALWRVLCWCGEERSGPPPLSTHLAVLVLLLPFSVHLFALAQSDAVLLWLVVESESRARSRPWLSGALWAAACLVKLPFLVLLPLAVLWREWRRLAGLLVGSATLLALPALRYGWAENLELLASWRAILAVTTPPMLCGRQNQSAFAVACTYLAGPSAAAGLTAAALALSAAVALGMALAALAVWRRDREEGQRAALGGGLYLTAFLSPLGWRTNLVAAAPLLYRLVGLARAGPAPGIRRAALAALLLLFLVQRANYEVAGKAGFEWLLEHRHYGLSTLFASLSALGFSALAARRRPA
jgi:hypothetical protein